MLLTCSLNVDPKQDLQQQHANEQQAVPAQQIASVAIVKHIWVNIIYQN